MPTRRIAVPAGGELHFVPDDWRDSIVLVEQGSIELESSHGARRTFVAGDALWLQGIPLRTLRNRGAGEAVLTATARRDA
jgi:hypothetical protein